MGKIYFTRHGQVGSGDYISEWGKSQLEEVRLKIAVAGFSGERILTSKAARCVETGGIIAPRARIIEICPALFKMLPFERILIIADDVLLEIMPLILDDEDTVVVGHDCMATVLAMKVIEKRGAIIGWDSLLDEYEDLDMGHGFLVDGVKLTYF